MNILNRTIVGLIHNYALLDTQSDTISSWMELPKTSTQTKRMSVCSYPQCLQGQQLYHVRN